MDRNGWIKEQAWESKWWGDCLNTYNEETKQFLYAGFMGIKTMSSYGVKAFDVGGQDIIDIGGGPTSMLLKTQTATQAKNSLVLPGMAIRGRGVVADPCIYPDWIKYRYEAAGIELWDIPGERLPTSEHFDEAWIYNVLQHTMSPREIIESAKAVSRTIRIFEWIDTRIAPGHPHSLTKEMLDEFLCTDGRTVRLTGESGCYGHAYYATV